MIKLKSKSVFFILVCILITSTNAYSRISGKITVKLYSEGKLVSTWDAKGNGRMVGSCYVFEENKIHGKKITVCGTFSVEEKK